MNDKTLFIALLGIFSIPTWGCTRAAPEPDRPAPKIVQTAPVPGADAAPEIDTPPSGPVLDAGAHGEGLVGWWRSDHCGARAYRRTLELRADGSFQADDIIHPCPGECVVQWSVQRQGKWTFASEARASGATGSEVHVVVEKTADPMKQASEAQPLPGTLVFDHGVIAERPPEGALCPYDH